MITERPTQWRSCIEYVSIDCQWVWGFTWRMASITCGSFLWDVSDGQKTGGLRLVFVWEGVEFYSISSLPNNYKSFERPNLFWSDVYFEIVFSLLVLIKTLCQF